MAYGQVFLLSTLVSGRLQQFLSGGGRDRQFLIFIRNL